MNDMQAERPTFAVIFKIHTWDGFIERQLDRLRRVTSDDTIYIVFDTTNKQFFPNSTLKSFEISEQIAAQSGLFAFPKSNCFWYNNDYPIFLFLDRFPQYDYVAVCEYDCHVTSDIETIVSYMYRNDIDFVGEKVRGDHNQWHWLPSVTSHYSSEEVIEGRLLCFSVFSARFCQSLKEKRLYFSKTIPDFSKKRGSTGVPLWPFGEAFIGAEIATQRLKSESLSIYGSVENYDWAPPFHERQLTFLGSSFVHPVLDDSRFLNSIFNKLHWKPTDLFIAGSDMRRWFYKIPAEIVVPLMAEVFLKQKDLKSIIDLNIYAEARHLKSHGALLDYVQGQAASSTST